MPLPTGVDGPEGAAQVARAESQVLVEARAVLPVEVDVEQFAVPQRLGDAVGEVEPAISSCPTSGLRPDDLWLVELGDQGEGVSDGRKQDVAARSLGFGSIANRSEYPCSRTYSQSRSSASS